MGGDFEKLRSDMVSRQLRRRGLADERVLRAMGMVPREFFVPRDYRQYAYDDGPLPIGEDQTISQPYMVALMAEQLTLTAADSVLEIGTGSGYAAAVISLLCAKVYTIERHGSLVAIARRRLQLGGYENVEVLHGNGYHGWPEHAPYDAILVSAGGTEVPHPLMDQLAIGGRLVIPVGKQPGHQRLLRVRRANDSEYKQDYLGEVAFVPLIDADAEGSA